MLLKHPFAIAWRQGDNWKAAPAPPDSADAIDLITASIVDGRPDAYVRIYATGAGVAREIGRGHLTVGDRGNVHLAQPTK